MYGVVVYPMLIKLHRIFLALVLMMLNITGDDENEFPFSQLKIKNKRLIKMPGGHHYDGNIDALCKQIVMQAK